MRKLVRDNEGETRSRIRVGVRMLGWRGGDNPLLSHLLSKLSLIVKRLHARILYVDIPFRSLFDRLYATTIVRGKKRYGF